MLFPGQLPLGEQAAEMPPDLSWSPAQKGFGVRALQVRIDLGPSRDSGRGPLLEFNVGSRPGDSTHYVNAKDMLSLSLLQARFIDLKLPIKIVEGE
jgi:hypothetical protein